jgi:D-amino-acid dehydrogenase
VDRVIWTEHLTHTSEPGHDHRIIRERQIAILSAMAIGVNRNIRDGEIVGDQERGIDDDEYKLVFSRLGDRMRVAGTAELNGFDFELN